MKLYINILTLNFLFTIFFATAQADFDGAPISLDAFASAAKVALAEHKVEASSGEIVFQDAAYSTDQEPLYDGAILAYVSERRIKIGQEELNVSYRLSLVNGVTDVVFTSFSDNFRSVGFSGLKIIPSKGQSLQEVVSLVESLNTSGNVVALDAINLVLVTWNETSIKQLLTVAEELNNAFPSITLELEKEVYRLPATFGKVTRLHLGEDEKVDLDQLRDIVPTFVKEGWRFSTAQSFIPAEFQ